MAFDITNAADAASSKTNVEPILVLEVDGVSTVYGARIIGEKAKIGATGLEIGNFKIGGLVAVVDQSALISLDDSTTRITQTINPDTGASTSISSMRVSLIDKDLEISELITPDDTVSPTFDMLGRKCKLWLGFSGTAWKQDFIIIFRGFIDEIDSGPGNITFNLAHPDTKKRSEAFQRADTELDGAITSGATTMTVDSTTNFLFPFSTTPTAVIDSATIKHYVRIDDEIIRYETGTATTFATLTRGELGTTAAAHDDDSSIESFTRLEGNAMTLALKLMLSGKNGPFLEDQPMKNFGFVSGVGAVTNSISFQGIDINRDFGLVTGDFITTTGASNGANNVTLKAIIEIVLVGSNSYMVIDGVSFVTETDTAGVIDFRSQYDTLGEGLEMDADHVDVLEHERLLRLFLSSFSYDFFIKDTIQGKQFIEEQIYNPTGGFGLPRKSRSSVGMHVGPLPGTNIKTLDGSNITNPSQLRLKRSTGINFQNTVTYRFDELALEDKFVRITPTVNATSLARIPVGPKALNITARGMRTSLQANTLIPTAANRRLRKYKFGAEFINNVKAHFGTGFNLETGDIVLFDMSVLKITDIQNGGTRSGESRLFQIDNKSIDFKTGDVALKIVDTNFDKDARLATISPASELNAGISATQFLIQESFSSIFGANEFKKWEQLIGASIRVRNSTYSIDGNAILESISGNTITLATSLGFTPAAGQIMELDIYDNQPEFVKLLYVFLSDGTNNFADGGIPYQFF